MNHLFKIISASLIVSYSYTSWASEDMEEKPKAPVKSLSLAEETRPNPSTEESIINLSIEDYIRENSDQRRLLLPCGHKPIQNPYYSTDIDNSYMIHEHKGWYTVDINAEIEPDYVADLNSPQALDYLFPTNTWDIIYLEKISFNQLTPRFFTKTRQSLRAGGILVFTPWWVEKFTRPVIVTDQRDSSTITLYIDMFYPSTAYYLAKESSADLYSYTAHIESETPIFRLAFLEEKLKTVFMDKFDFSDIRLYTDTLLDDKWMSEVNEKINLQYEEEFNSAVEVHQSASPEKWQKSFSALMVRINKTIDQERELVFARSRIWSKDIDPSLNSIPRGYVDYPFALDSYGLEFRKMRKGELFAIVKK